MVRPCNAHRSSKKGKRYMADSTFLSMIKVTFMTTQLENDCKIGVSLQKNCNNWFQKLYLNKPNDFWNNIVWQHHIWRSTEFQHNYLTPSTTVRDHLGLFCSQVISAPCVYWVDHELLNVVCFNVIFATKQQGYSDVCFLGVTDRKFWVVLYDFADHKHFLISS